MDHQTVDKTDDWTKRPDGKCNDIKLSFQKQTSSFNQGKWNNVKSSAIGLCDGLEMKAKGPARVPDFAPQPAGLDGHPAILDHKYLILDHLISHYR
jgi:hypothetical protein